MSKQGLKFARDSKGSNDGVQVLRFEKGKTYPVGPGPEEVGPELVKVFTEEQFVVDGDKKVFAAELVEIKKAEDAEKAKRTDGETPTKPKPSQKD